MNTPKSRFENIINKKDVDRPAAICPGGMMNMVTYELMKKAGVFLPEAHKDARQMADLAKQVYKEKCFENIGVPFCMTVEAEEMGADVDMGSDVVEPHVIKYVINSVDEWENLKEIDLSSGRSKVVLDAIKILKEEVDDVPIVGNLTGPISTASSLMEPVVFYKELRKKKDEAHKFLEFTTNQILKFALAQVDAGADIIAISDPSGTGEILGPKFFKEFAVKYINMIVDKLKENGVPTIVHICGQMHNVYAEVNCINSDVLSFDSIVPISEAKDNLKDRIIMGNISTYALEFSEPNKIKSLTKVCLKNGADIISPACGLGMKTPLLNIQEIIKTLEEEK